MRSTRDRTAQYSAYLKAIEVLEQEDCFGRVFYHAELAQWFLANGFPRQDAADQLGSILDMVLDVEDILGGALGYGIGSDGDDDWDGGVSQSALDVGSQHESKRSGHGGTLSASRSGTANQGRRGSSAGQDPQSSAGGTGRHAASRGGGSRSRAGSQAVSRHRSDGNATSMASAVSEAGPTGPQRLDVGHVEVMVRTDQRELHRARRAPPPGPLLRAPPPAPDAGDGRAGCAAERTPAECGGVDV